MPDWALLATRNRALALELAQSCPDRSNSLHPPFLIKQMQIVTLASALAFHQEATMNL